MNGMPTGQKGYSLAWSLPNPCTYTRYPLSTARPALSRSAVRGDPGRPARRGAPAGRFRRLLALLVAPAGGPGARPAGGTAAAGGRVAGAGGGRGRGRGGRTPRPARRVAAR